MGMPNPQDPGPFTVTVDVSAVDSATMGDEVINAAYKSLLLRLIGEGYTVADPDRGGDIMVRIQPSEKRSNLKVVVQASTATAERNVAIGDAAGEEAQLRLIHETLDLVRQAPGLPSPRPWLRSARQVHHRNLPRARKSSVNI